MKKMMLLTAVVFVATMVLGTTAEAQTLALKPLFAAVACKGNTAACVKLDLYQKMASTGSTASAASSGASNGASASSNPVTAVRGGAAGGVENNTVDGGGSSAAPRLQANSNHLARFASRGQRTVSQARANAERVQSNPRAVNTARPSATERRGYDAIHTRLVTRHRPID